MNITYLYHACLLLVLAIVFNGCEKDWLNAKRDLNAIVPTSLADMRAVLNNATSPSMADDYAGMQQSAAGEQQVTDAVFNFGAPSERNNYIWNSNIYDDNSKPVSEWDDSYRQVLNANVILEGVAKINRIPDNATEWDDVKGGALFFRAKAFYNLLQVFAAPYQAETASGKLGIPLRLGPDPGIPTTRASLSESYEQVLGDLKKAVPLLRVQPALKTDASRPAAYALLARCYLSMREYEKAGLYADSALQLFPTLMDYREVTAAADNIYPFAEMNAETILFSVLTPLSIFDANSLNSVVPELLNLYTESDKRRSLFFRYTGGFRGSYTGNALPFSGLASDEVYLIKAEGEARQGLNEEALVTLNHLLKYRYTSEGFVPYNIENTPDVLSLILVERRKELAFRGRRWNDLRRLNQEPAHAVTLSRQVKGQTYTLPPNDPRYTFPIPPYIIQLTGITQNER
ncbi:SusD family protein [bacterium A37T11]|nr:SusD family protein [bacterium A37T11]